MCQNSHLWYYCSRIYSPDEVVQPVVHPSAGCRDATVDAALMPWREREREKAKSKKKVLYPECTGLPYTPKANKTAKMPAKTLRSY